MNMGLKEINRAPGDINTGLRDINQKPRKQKDVQGQEFWEQKEVQENNKAMKIASNFTRILTNENVSPDSMPGVCTFENTAHRRCHQKSAHSTVK